MPPGYTAIVSIVHIVQYSQELLQLTGVISIKKENR